MAGKWLADKSAVSCLCVCVYVFLLFLPSYEQMSHFQEYLVPSSHIHTRCRESPRSGLGVGKNKCGSHTRASVPPCLHVYAGPSVRTLDKEWLLDE